MKRLLPLLLLLIVSCSTEANISSDTEKEKKQHSDTNSEARKKYSFRSFFQEEIGWGYDIFEGNKLIIHQVNIPSLPGNKGFESQEQSDRTARFIIEKLENGEFPPQVNPEELDSLDVI